jgi:CheY-like chemotaxis protein
MTVFEGKRVLIVEDNGLIGAMVADMISEVGARPIGPVITEREAMDRINHDPDIPDAAILDLGLDRSSADIAARLHELGIPFIFATGAPNDVPARFSHVPTCSKPYTIADLMSALRQAFEATPLAVATTPDLPVEVVAGHTLKLMIVTRCDGAQCDIS